MNEKPPSNDYPFVLLGSNKSFGRSKEPLHPCGASASAALFLRLLWGFPTKWASLRFFFDDANV